MNALENNRRTKVLAISSGGGHWVQMLRLAPAFEGAEVVYACTDASAASQVAPAQFHVFPDANKEKPIGLLISFLYIIKILMRTRPDVIVSTGAAGGTLAIALGRLFGIRGLFVDSIANARTLSFSARLSLRLTKHVFTQWPRVADTSAAAYRGSVL